MAAEKSHPPFILARDAVTPGDKSLLRRGAISGSLTRIRAGVYVETGVWGALGSDARYLARIHAAAVAYPEPLTFSHLSAAALWRLPMVGTWPAVGHVIAGRAAGGRSDKQLIRHCVGKPANCKFIDDLEVTGLARTVVDVGRTSLFGTAVAMADYALRKQPRSVMGVLASQVTMPGLRQELSAALSTSGSARCARVLDFADGASASPGESVSRVGMHLLGFTAPILQMPFSDSAGDIGIVDFWWPGFNLIGEFDGRGKYFRDEYTQGRSTADVVIAEKVREDRLRATGPSVTRWGWKVAQSLPLLRAHLMSAGLR
ncbi:MAG: hypothetical protein JWR57_969 [Mycetocola sp.]|nr:hypothetical protein [Mycetocola sp.]